MPLAAEQIFRWRQYLGFESDVPLKYVQQVKTQVTSHQVLVIAFD